jgi:hypothetical protein
MGSCTRHFLSVSTDTAERTSPSQMQRCKVNPPTRQNRNHTVSYNFRTSSIEEATEDKYGDRVVENYEGRGPHPPSWRSSTSPDLFFPPKKVRTEDNGDTPLLMSSLPVN